MMIIISQSYNLLLNKLKVSNLTILIYSDSSKSKLLPKSATDLLFSHVIYCMKTTKGLYKHKNATYLEYKESCTVTTLTNQHRVGMGRLAQMQNN
jgi:hypothetical protein